MIVSQKKILNLRVNNNNMETFVDSQSMLDISPRQIYVILRKDNYKVRRVVESVSKKCLDDDITGITIIDTTQIETPTTKSKLYKQFMDEGGDRGPWDIIVRKYPEGSEEYLFDCYHWNSLDLNAVKDLLSYVRLRQDQQIWERISDNFKKWMFKPSRTLQVNEMFQNTLESIVRNKGIEEEEDIEHTLRELEVEIQYAFHRGKRREEFVKEFVGNGIHIVDQYMRICVEPDESDRRMETYMRTGNAITDYMVRVDESPRVFTKTWTPYAIDIYTRDGRIVYPEFKHQFLRFSIYVLFLMLDTGEKVKWESFKNGCGEWSSIEIIQMLAAIYATARYSDISELYDDELIKAEEKCVEEISDMINDQKKWQNHANIAAFLKKAVGEDYVLFDIQKDQAQGTRWINLTSDHISFCKKFKQEYFKNLNYIEKNKWFNKQVQYE